MSKFKKGDIVVCVRLRSRRGYNDVANIGDVFEVESTFIGNLSGEEKIATKDRKYFFADDFEFSHIVDTPLYKALK